MAANGNASSTLEKLRREIRTHKVRNVNGRRFLPHGVLERIVDESTIKSCVPGISTDLVSFIRQEALKIFATLVDSRHHSLKDALTVCRQHSLTDASLPIVEDEQTWCKKAVLGSAARGSTCNHGRHLNVFHEDSWADFWDDFSDHQWDFLAPVFDTTKFDDYKFPESMILPIISYGSESQGHFGVVTQAYMHPNHLKNPTTKNSREEPSIAMKKFLRTRDRDPREPNAKAAWRKEVLILEDMERHPHLIGGIAAIAHGTEYYILSPWADGGDLENFWRTNEKPTPDADLVRELIAQLHGLAGALEALHNCPTRAADGTNSPPRSGPNLVVPEAEAQNRRHGDLKPANILQCSSPSKRLGTLKIADLGLTKKHFQRTGHRNTPSVTTMGTKFYEPPEVVTDRFGPRSRRYDIWSFGCIAFEMVVWLLYGHDGLTQLWDLHPRKDLDPFYYEQGDGSRLGQTARVSPLVANALQTILKYDPECQGQGSILGKLLRLIRDKMLVVDLGTRVDSTELVVDLSELRKRASEPGASRYLWRGSDRSQMPFENIARYLDSARPSVVRQSSGQFLSPPVAQHAHGPDMLLAHRGRTYYHEPLDPTWTCALDNDFATRALQTIPASCDTEPDGCRDYLCSRCRALVEDIFNQHTTFQLNFKDLFDACGLCAIISHAISEPVKEYLNDHSGQPTFLRRIGSKIVLDLGSEQKRLLSMNAARSRFTPADPLRTDSSDAAVASLSTSHLSEIQMSQPELWSASGEAHSALLQQWLRDCDAHHKPTCHTTVYNKFLEWPTRVVKVGLRDDHDLRLVESEELRDNDRYPRFAALSYPWGDPNKHRRFFTDTSNYDQHRQAIMPSDLPLVFRDAIAVTRNLGIEYLWIDALCIIQGPGGDFDQEAERMEHVFSSAYVVLAASCATGASDGFLQPRKQPLTVRIPESDLFLSEDIDDFQQDVIDGHLNRRGWVLQERALARRTIYFAGSQTYWECGHGVRCQTFTRIHNKKASFLGDADFPRVAGQDTKGAQISFFESLYEQYSRLELSCALDRPLAIAGLERRLCRALNTEGGFGVFHIYLERSLLWQRAVPDVAALVPIDFSSASTSVPSWSWMAYSGGIKFLLLPFAGIEWTTSEYRSPWATTSTSSTGSASRIRDRSSSQLRVIPRDFYDDDRAQMDVVWDCGTAVEGPLKCVIIGKLRQEAWSPSQTHYVLVVQENVVVGTWRRVGVGRLPKDKIEIGPGKGFEKLC